MSLQSRSFPFYVMLIALLLTSAAGAQSSKPLLENDRVRVTRVDLPTGETLPNDARYDVATVRLGDGDTVVSEPGQLEKPDTHPLGDSHYFTAMTRRGLKNRGKQAVPFIQIQFLRAQGKYVAFEVPPFHYCNPGSQKACVTERYLYCTDRFCAETVVLEPGAASTQHIHDADYMVVATSDFSWRNEPVGKPAFDETFKVGDVKYIEPGGTHRLVNTGGTTARLFVIQFK
jgi:mannose-6-phosphate isomerase-like protein (cupin superfamily)